jgi:hypothetical protein
VRRGGLLRYSGIITGIWGLGIFKGWVVGFYSEWSDELTKLPKMLADAQIARWQSKYGRNRGHGPTA